MLCMLSGTHPFYQKLLWNLELLIHCTTTGSLYLSDLEVAWMQSIFFSLASTRVKNDWNNQWYLFIFWTPLNCGGCNVGVWSQPALIYCTESILWFWSGQHSFFFLPEIFDAESRGILHRDESLSPNTNPVRWVWFNRDGRSKNGLSCTPAFHFISSPRECFSDLAVLITSLYSSLTHPPLLPSTVAPP